MRKTDLAYAAGIVDGEGSIGLYHQSKRSINVKVTVSNTNEWLIQWFKFAFGGGVSCQKNNRKWKPIWRWEIGSEPALEFLRLVTPFLRLKKAQSELAIKFLEMRGRKGRHFTEKEHTIAEVERMLMRNLNSRGNKSLIVEV